MHEIVIPPPSGRMFRPFVPDAFLVKIERMLDDLSGKSVAEQLRHQRIKKIRVSYTMPERAGYLVPSKDNDSFEIILSAKGEDLWPLVVGHEIAHSFSYVMLGSRLRSIRGELTGSKEEEALCDSFSFCWLAEEHNSEELTRLLVPLVTKKDRPPQPEEYQLEFPLWGF